MHSGLRTMQASLSQRCSSTNPCHAVVTYSFRDLYSCIVCVQGKFVDFIIIIFVLFLFVGFACFDKQKFLFYLLPVSLHFEFFSPCGLSHHLKEIEENCNRHDYQP